jgi:agmatine/peptidylarginine deiminase
MPIQLGENEFVKYRNYPNYLVSLENIATITDATNVLRGMGINCRYTNLIIDGGNKVPCGPYIVMIDKVFTENRFAKEDANFKALLESELGRSVIVISWTQHKGDKYGHSDGFVKWCGDNRILMGNHGDCYPKEAVAICQTLESYGFEVTEMRFKDKVEKTQDDFNWAYINFLQVGKNIIMPAFGKEEGMIEEDMIALKYIQRSFP